MILFKHGDKVLCEYSDYQGIEEIRETKELLAYENGISIDKITVHVNNMPDVGDIMTYSWGYDQTNIQFFQVVRTTKKTITMREIKSERVKGSDGGFMSDKCVPVKGSFVTETELRKKVYWFHDVPHVNMPYGSCGLWDGNPENRSWYA